MNLAPYILARIAQWELPDDELCESASAIVANDWPFFHDFARRTALFRAVNFDEILKSEAQRAIGIYEVAQNTWQTMVAGVERQGRQETLPSQFVRAVYLENRDSVLLFPDDSTPDYYISVFCPHVNVQNDVVLHSIRFLFDPILAEVGRVETADAHCTLAVRGAYPSRTFACSRTGCRKDCKKLRHVEKNRVSTVSCSC